MPNTLEKLIEDVFLGSFNNADNFPPMDAYTIDEMLYIEFAIAGLNINDIKIGVHGNKFTLSTNKTKADTSDNRKYLRKRIAYRAFSNDYYVGDEYNLQNMSASFNNGILKLEIPKAFKVTKYITIQ